MYRTLPGLEHVKIVRNAYAIEYDCINPNQLYATLEFKNIKGLFSGGQFNGSSGYEEAPVEIRIFAERDSEMGLFFMHKKGGYMGGRGSNSNLGGGSGSGLKTTGLDVMHNGETTRYYFTSKDGQNDYQREIREMADEIYNIASEK